MSIEWDFSYAALQKSPSCSGLCTQVIDKVSFIDYGKDHHRFTETQPYLRPISDWLFIRRSNHKY